VVISTTDATAIAKLKQANETLAQQWEADAQLTPEQRKQGMGTFSENWYTDRTAMLAALVYRNQSDITAPLGAIPAPTRHAIYQDTASDQTLRVLSGLSELSEYTPIVRFGADGADTLVGSTGADRLYGGAGDDTIPWRRVGRGIRSGSSWVMERQMPTAKHLLQNQ
jgi:hypothetical protein